MKNSKLLVAMSGGVDSSAALVLLKEQGCDCTGITFMTDRSEGSFVGAADAREAAKRLGIPHVALDIEREFTEKVKEEFVRVYEEGGTPNPCVVCNREIKFGLLLRYAEEHGFDGVATGHYVRTCTEGGRVRLMRGTDSRKDQSYMLAAVPESALSKAVFPLGGLTKDEIRRIAAEAGISSAHKKDSQDICFVPDGDYVGFIERYRGRSPTPGVFVDGDGKLLGENRGQLCYTVGQGRGLGIALGRKVYVTGKDAAGNTVTLGDESELYKTEVYIKNINLIGTDSLPDRCTVKLRYAHRGAAAAVSAVSDGAMLRFEESQRAPTAGQLAVLYDGELVIGSGEIALPQAKAEATPHIT